MKRKDILKMCLQNLKRRKSRTFLTLLGVLIGCCSIVIMISIGIGMAESQKKLLAEMGDLSIITVTSRQGKKGKDPLNDRAIASFRSLPHVAAVTPKVGLDDYDFTVTLYAGTNDRYTAYWSTVAGIDPAALDGMGYKLVSGNSSLKPGEFLAGQYLAYGFADSFRPEGSNMVNRWGEDFSLDGESSPPPDPYFDASTTPVTIELDVNGKKLRKTFQPVGMLKEDYVKGGETSEGLLLSMTDLAAMIQEAKGTGKELSYKTVLVKADDITQVASVEKKIRELGFSTSSMESIRAPMEKEARQKQLMLGGLGAISLFVAALGITNTMIMSISERTREIGVMKSLGCHLKDIRMLFLAEAGAIGLMGGIVGCLVSLLIALIINLVSLGVGFGPSSLLLALFGGEGITRVCIVPPWLLAGGILFSVAIGLGSGYYPANKAVQVSALEAIKSS